MSLTPDIDPDAFATAIECVDCAECYSDNAMNLCGECDQYLCQTCTPDHDCDPEDCL